MTRILLWIWGVTYSTINMWTNFVHEKSQKIMYFFKSRTGNYLVLENDTNELKSVEQKKKIQLFNLFLLKRLFLMKLSVEHDKLQRDCIFQSFFRFTYHKNLSSKLHVLRTPLCCHSDQYTSRQNHDIGCGHRIHRRDNLAWIYQGGTRQRRFLSIPSGTAAHLTLHVQW